jgi:hypothetical protein
MGALFTFSREPISRSGAATTAALATQVADHIGYVRAGHGSVLVAERDPPLSPGAIGQAAMTACSAVY